ncbi:geranylgeranylglycerol-phosphate geranylgeranyltransferase [Mesohalobacter halotolerans]|uniref:Ubiquinone biosynthesis protein UbiA n=1 Tax=Mesohalobacter halotolerans TaxID=1883405 RepID=A0A4V6XYB5_9FLAO|nr:geranylgeranylglycerol-phosphate geranylgeranyltransferase [Mesohalobacter halotolerans]TKS57135.1 ubiquinone biosynthesis protein UbiA [Mesohalobacter halotolerans]
MSFSNKSFFYKIAGLFVSVRGYNILIIILAQYLASIFIISPDYLSLRDVVFDVNLFIIVCCSALVIASGYIINSFYDSEKDLINKPFKTYLDNKVSQNTKLSVYFILNFLSVILASYVSFRTVIFFSAYIFGIWFYSHKLKKITFLGNIVAALLAIVPFFAVFVYYKNFEKVIFFHAVFLFLLILIREIIKDLENLTGDFAQDYQTLPVRYSEQYTKVVLSILISLALITNILLIQNFDLGYMDYYFYVSLIGFMFFFFLIWKSKYKIQFSLLHNLLKLIIVLGVFSILLIDVDLVLNKLLNL